MGNRLAERFPDDHPIAALRGVRHLTRSAVRRELAQRTVWLAEQIALRVAEKRPHHGLLQALIATIQAVEGYTAATET